MHGVMYNTTCFTNEAKVSVLMTAFWLCVVNCVIQVYQCVTEEGCPGQHHHILTKQKSIL